MKTNDLNSKKISSELIGTNPPFELETYVELEIFISGITAQELADKESTREYIIGKLSENLNLSHTHVTEFEAISNQEPFDMTMKLNVTLVKNNISRFQLGNVDDIKFEMLEILQANIVNLS